MVPMWLGVRRSWQLLYACDFESDVLSTGG